MQDPTQSAPRTHVGYKRPPVETQFKKGQKPPARKKKPELQEGDPTRIFWAVLQQPRRALINNKAQWATTAELIVRAAFIEAESGSSILQRLLNQMLLGKHVQVEDEFQVYSYPD